MLKEKVSKLSMDAFRYELPENKIAFFPVEPRDSSKLLVYREGLITDKYYKELNEQLPENTLLIANNTKVVEARLLFEKTSGAKIEVFCLEPDTRYADVVTGMQQKGSVFWKCMIGGAKKWKDEVLTLTKGDITLKVKKSELTGSPSLLCFDWSAGNISFAEILHIFGNIPLPPYIKRQVTPHDHLGYQTVYAQHDGSVAAPTAGLHFTENLLNRLKATNIHTHFVTLHVGAGTFMPVKSSTLEDHEMHAEYIDVCKSFILNFLEHRGAKVCVGTTSLRTLETLYWMGVKVLTQPTTNLAGLKITQWDAYELPQDTPCNTALNALVHWMYDKDIENLVLPTQLLIAPGYTIRSVDGILTNFHQPESTLLLLIHGFVGEDWKRIYDHALSNDYRFLSFGDGSLLWKR